MIKHIVMWKLGDDQDRNADKAELLKSELEKLPDLIPQIAGYEVGIDISRNERSFDVVLLSEFHDENDLEIYRTHPAHKQAVDKIRSLTDKAHFVDFVS